MRFQQFIAATLVALACAAHSSAADPPHKPTHTLRAVQVEVAPAQPNGNAWDTGFGAFTRPDPQVTLWRRDPVAEKRAAELFVLASERRLQKLGQPIDPRLSKAMLQSAPQALRCGKAIETLQDQPLNEVRARFAADTDVASDTLLAKLTGGALPVAVGDVVLVYVNDIDLAAHDALGETEIAITKELLAKGNLELKFGSVLELRLQLSPLGK